MIIIANCYNEDLGEKKESVFVKLSHKKLTIRNRCILIGIVVVLVSTFMYMYNSRVTGYVPTEVVEGENLDTLQYTEENRMPKWSGFYKYWVGLYDLENGPKTKAVYDDNLIYDEDGIAWDHDGHFVDTDGNIVITVSEEVLNKRAARNTMLIYFMELMRGEFSYNLNYDMGMMRGIASIVNGTDKNNYVRWKNGYIQDTFCLIQDDELPVSKYFWNGMAVYYSEVSGGYGFIDESGNVIVNPDIYDFDASYSMELIPVTMKNSNRSKVYNSKGVAIVDLDDSNSSGEYKIYEDCKLITYYTNDSKYTKVIDYSGNPVTPDAHYTGSAYADNYGVLLTMKLEDGTYAALDKSGSVVFESDKYSSFIACYNSDNKIVCALAYDANAGQYALIDMDGNVINDYLFSSFYSISIDNGIMMCQEPGGENLDIITADGKVIRTPYIFSKYISFNNYIEVLRINEDGISEYNFIDFEGNLLSDEWNYK